jgi:2-polyprenyl-6-methoxyphenol hydroxylase-like FAD-dependent oxidoreductase
VGGLCLAQGLRRRAVTVTVFERSARSAAGSAGGLLRVEEPGEAALASCLPAELYDLYQATRDRRGASHPVFYDHHLNLVTDADPDAAPADPMLRGSLVDRRLLSRILLAGLGESVRFGAAVERYEQVGNGVRLRLADGTTATGDVLVAADGVSSVIRRQLVPQFEVVDTGLRALCGQLPLEQRWLDGLPAAFLRDGRPVLGPRRCSMLLRVFQPYLPPDRAATLLAPYAELPPLPGYLMWTLVLPAALYPSPAGRLSTADPAALHRIAVDITAGWHPAIRRIVAECDPATVSAAPVRASMPVCRWPVGPVTVLGEAIHVVPSVGEYPVDQVLADAGALASALSEVRDAGFDLLPAIERYEEQLRRCGCAAVNRSLRDVVEREWGYPRVDQA